MSSQNDPAWREDMKYDLSADAIEAREAHRALSATALIKALKRLTH